MKTAFITTVVFLIFVSKAMADNFQIQFRDNRGILTVAYCAVKLLDKNDNVLFRGYTDKYGRININANPGTYNGVIIYKKRSYTITISITKSSSMRTIFISEHHSSRKMLVHEKA